jgi:hypothetical protein
MTGETDPRVLTLDILPVKWGDAIEESDCAIVMEVWPSGALLQTSRAVSAGLSIEVSVGGSIARFEVLSCEQDPYGFVIEIGAVNPENWFPTHYYPTYQLPK